MKGNKFESRGNYQHHFMDDENKAESLSDSLNGLEVRGARAAGPPGGPQGKRRCLALAGSSLAPLPCSWRMLLCHSQLCWKQLTEGGQHKDVVCNSNGSGKNSSLHLIPRREGLILITSEPATDRPKLSRMISPQVCQNSQHKINFFPMKVPVSWTAALRRLPGQSWQKQPEAMLYCSQG